MRFFLLEREIFFDMRSLIFCFVTQPIFRDMYWIFSAKERGADKFVKQCALGLYSSGTAINKYAASSSKGSFSCADTARSAS